MLKKYRALIKRKRTATLQLDKCDINDFSISTSSTITTQPRPVIEKNFSSIVNNSLYGKRKSQDERCSQTYFSAPMIFSAIKKVSK